MIAVGLLSGILCGLFGVSALLVAYVSRTAENHSQFRANNCVVFMVENTFRLALYTATGIMTMDVVKNAVCLLPFMAAGLGIGIFFEKHIPERQAKRCVILLLILSGLSLIGTNLAITGTSPFCWNRTPGFGDTDWVDIFTILMQHGFVGSCDIEGYHDPVFFDDLEWSAQLTSLDYLKRCRGGVEFFDGPTEYRGYQGRRKR